MSFSADVKRANRISLWYHFSWVLFFCIFCSCTGIMLGVAWGDDIHVLSNDAAFAGLGITTSMAPHGPFNVHMWQKTPYADMVDLVSHVDGYTHSAVLNQGVLDVLRSSFMMPPVVDDGKGNRVSFFNLRISKLLFLGDIRDVDSFYRLLSEKNMAPHTLQVLTVGQILAGHDVEPCKILSRHAANVDVKSVFWQKVSVACSVFAGDAAGANMGLSILTSMNENVKGLSMLVTHILAGKPITLHAPENLDVFDYYVLRASAKVPEGLDRVHNVLILKSIFLWNKVPLETRLIVGQKLWDRGYLDPETFREFAKTLSAPISGDGKSLLDKELYTYALFERALEKGDILGQEKAIVQALALAKEPRDFVLISHVYGDFLLHLRPDINMRADFAPLMTAIVFNAQEGQAMTTLNAWVNFASEYFSVDDQVQLWPFMVILKLSRPHIKEAWLTQNSKRDAGYATFLLRVFSGDLDKVPMLDYVQKGSDDSSQVFTKRHYLMPFMIKSAFSGQSAALILSSYHMLGSTSLRAVPPAVALSMIASFDKYPVCASKILMEFLLSINVLKV